MISDHHLYYQWTLSTTLFHEEDIVNDLEYTKLLAFFRDPFEVAVSNYKWIVDGTFICDHDSKIFKEQQSINDDLKLYYHFYEQLKLKKPKYDETLCDYYRRLNLKDGVLAEMLRGHLHDYLEIEALYNFITDSKHKNMDYLCFEELKSLQPAIAYMTDQVFNTTYDKDYFFLANEFLKKKEVIMLIHQKILSFII